MVISIEVDGLEVMAKDKAKYLTAQRLGVMDDRWQVNTCCFDSFYMDRLYLPCQHGTSEDLSAAAEFLTCGYSLTVVDRCADHKELMSTGLGGTHQELEKYLSANECRFESFLGHGRRGSHQFL